MFPYTVPGTYPIGTWNVSLNDKSAALWATEALQQSYSKAHSAGFNLSSRIQSITAVWPHPYGYPWQSGSWYKYAEEAGLPPGVINEIYLDATFDPLNTQLNREFFFTSPMHESGHYIMFKLYNDTMPLAVTQYIGVYTTMGFTHNLNKKSSPGFAWMEGWAEFWAAAVHDDPQNPQYENMTYGTTNWDAYGQEVEGWVAVALWDLLDNHVDDYTWYQYDKSSFALSDIWNRLANGGTTQRNFEDFWAKWQSDLPATVENAKRSIYQGTMVAPFPPATPVPFIASQYSIAAALTSAGIAGIQINLDKTVDSADSSTGVGTSGSSTPVAMGSAMTTLYDAEGNEFPPGDVVLQPGSLTIQ